jgi:signal recognition particle subunit SRP19
MSHARVEELSDSDPDIDDPSALSFPQTSSSIIAPADIPEPGAFTKPPPPSQNASQDNKSGFMPSMLRPTGPGSRPSSKESIKAYSTLYPVYFDASRTRAQGRRVSAKLGTHNPLARAIAEACQFISVNTAGGRLQIAFEPDKLHPKDWANPGRVRVSIRNRETGKPLSPALKNKSHLYILVAQYLQAHPTTKESPLKLQIQGIPVPEKLEPPAVPRGWKINEILPLHSPAMSGGGVSDNFFKDMMAEMQREGGGGGPHLPPGMAGMMNSAGGAGAGRPGSGGDGGRKRDKKKGK